MFIIAIITIFRSAISGNQSNEPSLKNWGPETKPLTSYTQCGKRSQTLSASQVLSNIVQNAKLPMKCLF